MSANCIGKRLKVAREKIGYSLVKAAAVSGLSKCAISNFEKGKREPKFSEVAKLAIAYRCALSYFYSAVDNKRPILAFLWEKKR